MAADIEQVDGQVLRVEPVVAEHVAAQLGRGHEAPVHADVSTQQPGGQQRLDVAGRLGEEFRAQAGQFRLPLLIRQRAGRLGRDERPRSLLCGQNPFPFQFRVGLDNSVWVHGKFHRQGSNRGELFSRSEQTRGNAVADLVLYLPVNRHATPGI